MGSREGQWESVEGGKCEEALDGWTCGMGCERLAWNTLSLQSFIAVQGPGPNCART